MSTLDTRRLGQIGFATLTIGFFLYVASPLILPVAMGAVFAILLWPLQSMLEKKKIPKGLAALGLSSATTVLVLIPLSFFVTIAIKEALRQIYTIQDKQVELGATGIEESILERVLYSETAQNMIEKISQFFPVSADELILSGQDAIQTAALKLADILGQGLASVPMILVALAVVVVSLFFFLVDGTKVVNYFRKASVFPSVQTDELIQSVGAMCRGVVYGSLISGIVQATLFCLTCLVVGQSGIFLIFILVVLSSFVPLLGSTPVTLSIAIYQILIGNTSTGIILGIVGLIATVLDNIIRPLVMKGAANLHPLIAFVGAFGGLQVLGVSGIFIGPIVAGVFVAILKILGDRHAYS